MDRETLIRVIEKMITTIDTCQELERARDSGIKSESFYCLSEIKGCLTSLKHLHAHHITIKEMLNKDN